MTTEENIHAHHRERTFSKFLKNPDAFAEHEILEILLFYVVKRQDTNPLAHRILNYFKNLNAVFSADVNTLMKIKGVGEKTALFLKLVGTTVGICKQQEYDDNSKKYKFSSLRDIKPLLDKFFNNSLTEKFLLLMFDEKHSYINSVEIASASKFTAEIDAGVITDAVSVCKPKFAVIAHNHLSGNSSPSSADDYATAQISMILDMLSVTLLDHVIVTKNGNYSYFSEGKIDEIKLKYNLKKFLTHPIKEEL